jgi:hypothetical protein
MAQMVRLTLLITVVVAGAPANWEVLQQTHRLVEMA